MWRLPGEQFRQFAQINAVSPFEGELTAVMLLEMVIGAEADRPPIRRFEADAAVGVAADMSALDRPSNAARDTAVMAPHPGAVSGTFTAVRLPRLLGLKPVREL